MPDEKFKLPRSSYEELTRIIRTYGHLSEPASLDAVSKLLSANKTLISANAGFLTAIEILEPGQKKQASSKGRELAQALEYEMPNEIRKAWRAIIYDNDFLTRLLSAIKIRKGMDESTLTAHIAYSAGQPRKPYVMTGARTVVDILRAAELIQESDGRFSAIDVTVGIPETEEPSETRPSTAEAESVKVLTTEPRHPGLQIRIQVNINCSPSELDGLSEKLRELIDSLPYPKDFD